MSTIRRLNTGEGTLYREVRLESLRESPDAFCSSYEDALARTDESWNEQADASASGGDRATFVAFRERPVGLVALYRDDHDREVGELIQMWVCPEERGGSTADDLITEVFKWAASNRFLRVKAEVIEENQRALRFYQKLGFIESSDPSTHSTPTIVLTRDVSFRSV